MLRLFMRKSSLQLCLFFLFFIGYISSSASDMQKHTVLLTDSTRLATYVFRPEPADSLPRPSILVRTKTPFQQYADAADFFTRHGYNFVVQYTRGNEESTGKESFFLTDGNGDLQDGAATLDWMGTQFWSNKKVGGFGFGIDGFLAHLLATTNHRYLQAEYILAAPYNFFADVAFPGGVYRKNFLENWTKEIGAKYLLHTFELSPYASSFWDPLANKRSVKSVDIPICHIGGWFQPFVSGTVAAHRSIAVNGNTPGKLYQYLILGPWRQDPASYSRKQQAEMVFPENSTFDFLSHAMQFFDRWLKNAPSDSLSLREIVQQDKIKYYLMGDAEAPNGTGNKWIDATSWPPENARYKKYYLKHNGTLALDEAEKNGNAEAFRYDPLIPVQTLGGANYYLPSGPMDQRAIEQLDEVLVFSSDTLKTALTVAGPLRFQLFAASSARDTDFAVKLCDVYPDGRSILLSEGIIRARHRNTMQRSELLEPHKVEKYLIDLGHTANVFEAGHQLRITITSSNSPKFEPNPNLPKALHRNDGQITAVNYIYYGGKRKSGLILPIIEK
ncbi:MAG: CocE/NonD family hydrolase [Calditrichaeota bacterium]|nr:MAG: CocE/NonD family hydrolase [Calditrichota bacterium]